MFVIMMIFFAVMAAILFIQFKFYGHHPRKIVSGDTSPTESVTEMLTQL